MKTIISNLKLSGMVILAFAALFMASCDSTEEPAVVPNMYVEDISRFEGNTGESTTLSFRIRLDQSTTADVTVDYTTTNGDAVAGEDFEATAGTATIPAGSTEANVDVTVIGDDDYELDEAFELSISNANGATISGDAGVGTIRNDDAFVPTDNDGYSTPTSYAGYNLVWADEFDGSELNLNDWTYETGTGNSGWGNNELQYYRDGDNNSYVSSGKLVIEAKDEGFGGRSYTSARIITQNKQSFQYGRIDIRAQLPEGQGIWPALWMLGDNFATSGWPSCGEIDIMELVGHLPSTVYGTAHWSSASNQHAEYGGNRTLTSGKFIDEYHVFSIIWDAQSIKWYLDDIPYHTLDITPSHLSEMKAPFFFIFNVAVGGNWPGSPDATTVFPQRMIVDYVRVFQLQ